MKNKNKRKGFWKNAFAVEKAEDFKPTEKELATLDRVAEKIAERGLALPSILFLESIHPLNYIGAQAMAFFEPVVRAVFSEWEAYTVFYKTLERRGSIACLIERIDHFENQRQKRIKSKRKKDKSSSISG